MLQDDFDFLLRLHIDLQIVLRAQIGMSALNVLPDHDQRHEENLDQVRDEKPEHEAHRRVKLKAFRRQHVPAQPDHGPAEDDEKEAHGPDIRGDPHREAIQWFQLGLPLFDNVARRFATPPQLVKGHRHGRVRARRESWISHRQSPFGRQYSRTIARVACAVATRPTPDRPG